MPEAFKLLQWTKMKAARLAPGVQTNALSADQWHSGIHRVQRQMGPSLSKRRRMTTPKILEEGVGELRRGGSGRIRNLSSAEPLPTCLSLQTISDSSEPPRSHSPWSPEISGVQSSCVASC